VRPGEEVELRHPRRVGPVAFRMVTSRVRVAGLHPNPLRFTAYMDRREAARFGLAGLANTVQARPAAGTDEAAVRRALLELPGVRSVLLGTAAGIAAGYAVLRWITGSLLPRTLPDIGVTASLTVGTVVTTLAIGSAAVAAAVLLTAPRVRRMDIPATLRVVE